MSWRSEPLNGPDPEPPLDPSGLNEVIKGVWVVGTRVTTILLAGFATALMLALLMRR